MDLVCLIREEILALPDSESSIREADLVEKFKVSRSSVRDALKQLEVEKLIVRTKSKGTTLRKFTLKEVSDIYDLRSVLEGLAASLAARNATREQLAELQQLADQCEAAADNSEVRTRCDDAFHRLIMSISNNRQLEEIVNNFAILRQIFALYRKKNIGQRRLDHSPFTHQKIAAAIAAGDSAQAEKIMRNHINWAKNQHIEEFIQQKEK